MIDISDELRERYKQTAEIVYVHRADKKTEFNQRARAALDLMRETLPALDDNAVFSIFSSIAYMLSTFMLAPLARAGKDIEEMFDAYTLACASLAGVVDLDDETPPESQDAIVKKALTDEIERLKGELEKATQRPTSDENTGQYL